MLVSVKQNIYEKLYYLGLSCMGSFKELLPFGLKCYKGKRFELCYL